MTLVGAAVDALIASARTDLNGRYTFSSAENVSFSGALVNVASATYTTETRYVLMYRDEAADFDLVPAERVPLGGSVRGAVGEDRCAGLGYGGSGGTPCRRLTVIVPAAGMLRVSLTPAPGSAFDLAVLRPDGAVGVETSTNARPLTVRLSVNGGHAYQIDVVSRGPSPDFELATALEP